MSSPASTLWIITGPIQVGKTHFCNRLVECAQARGLKLAGVICPPIFSEGQKSAISIEDLISHERKTLAIKRTNETKGLMTDYWAFDEQVMSWANCVLAETKDCDLLLIDELGPLEFNRGQGWQNGLHALDNGEFGIAVVVIRPVLLETALKRWPQAQVVEIPAQLDFENTQKLVDKILQG